MRVLVADDEADFRELLREYLALHDIEVLEAVDGLEALRHVSRGGLEAVLLDLRMPRLGGIDALRRIRIFDPSLAVVVVTAAIEPELHREARARGARAVFQKPVALPDLLAALQGHDAAAWMRDGVGIAPADPTRPARQPSSAPRILVVDDDADLREMLVDFLTRRGYETSTAADAASAIRDLVGAPADAVLLDIGLPGLSGSAALPVIRALAPRTAVIMVSGTTDREVAKQTLGHGAFDYLVKPVNLTYLAQSLEVALAMNALEI